MDYVICAPVRESLGDLDLRESTGFAHPGDTRSERFEELVLVLSHRKAGTNRCGSGVHTVILTMRNAVHCTPNGVGRAPSYFYQSLTAFCERVASMNASRRLPMCSKSGHASRK
jgi:hypothetical protein